MNNKVSLIHYDIGNLLSVERALEYIGVEVVFAKTADDILSADKLLLPGVGAFESCKKTLDERGLSDAIIRKVTEEKVPLLGICVGMQMLFDRSEEFGSHAGFGFIPGTVQKIDDIIGTEHSVKIPHIGWSPLLRAQGNSSALLNGMNDDDSVYFVHSYAATDVPESSVSAYVGYGSSKIVASVEQGNIHGTQFHPEKSGEIGLGILKNFIHNM